MLKTKIKRRRNSCAISLSKNGYNSYSELEFLLPVPQSEYMSINNLNMISENATFPWKVRHFSLKSSIFHIMVYHLPNTTLHPNERKY